ncbi:MAG: hypothetical protein APR54_13010, partial [Candidatus Cloacimonas sp. SDB]
NYIIISVGFLKQSGFKNIEKNLMEFCKKSTNVVHFYIGTGYGETDPKTLKNLFNLIKSNKENKLILCTPEAGIFHPKIYLFMDNSKVTLIVGSANLTEAGWIVNDEVSLKVVTDKNSKLYMKFYDYFKDLYKKYYTDDILELINKYKSDLDSHKKKHKRTPKFIFRRNDKLLKELDLPRLMKYFETYKKSEEFIDPYFREKQYRKALENLEIIAGKDNLSKTEFHDLFGPLVGHNQYTKLWHSGGLHRRTYSTLNYIPAFRQLVRKIKKIKEKPIEQVYDESITFLNSKRENNEIYGIGENIITEILMSYDFYKFANLNKNPISVLNDFGKRFKAPQSFTGRDYKYYVDTLSSIKEKLKVNSFLEIDSFFNYIYWILKEEKFHIN